MTTKVLKKLKRRGPVYSDRERLDRIAEIIEAVDNRCLAADGPVTPTLAEMEQAEISEIYALAKRRK